MIDSKIVNGVNVTLFNEAIDTVNANPTFSKFKFRAKNTWMNGGYNLSLVKEFYGTGQEHDARNESFVLENDEPEVLLGTDKGANPLEYILHALAGSLTTSIIYHAAVKGIKIDEIESELQGELDFKGFMGLAEDIRKGYNNINILIKIKGDSLSEKQIIELCEMGKKHSPVFDIISNPVPINIFIEKS